MRKLDNITVERRNDEVIIKDGEVMLAEMTAEYALEIADAIVKHADKILANG